MPPAGYPLEAVDRYIYCYHREFRRRAAYLARRRYGYPSTEIARVLGYRGPSSVGAAVARIEAAGKDVDATLAKLQKQLSKG